VTLQYDMRPQDETTHTVLYVPVYTIKKFQSIQNGNKTQTFILVQYRPLRTGTVFAFLVQYGTVRTVVVVHLYITKVLGVSYCNVPCIDVQYTWYCTLPVLYFKTHYKHDSVFFF
jgi:hypothetical protein